MISTVYGDELAAANSILEDIKPLRDSDNPELAALATLIYALGQHYARAAVAIGGLVQVAMSQTGERSTDNPQRADGMDDLLDAQGEVRETQTDSSSVDAGADAESNVGATPDVEQVTCGIRDLFRTPSAEPKDEGAAEVEGADASSEEVPLPAEPKPPGLQTSKLGRVALFTDGIMFCVDVEHTGGSADAKEIIQLAAMCVDRSGRTVGSSFNEFVLTKRTINFHAAAVHKITIQKLREEAKGDFGVVGLLFVNWLAACVAETGASEATLVAHNGVSCDFRLICIALATHGLELPTTVRWQLLDSLGAIRSAGYYDVADNYPVLTSPSKKAPLGKPSLRLMVLAEWLLATRAKYAQAGPDGARATVESFGQAHDALADVRALVVVLTDEAGLWQARSDGVECALSLQDFLDYGTAMKAYLNSQLTASKPTVLAKANVASTSSRKPNRRRASRLPVAQGN
jgi:DNA polymerase III epsilon subunit-like protein